MISTGILIIFSILSPATSGIIGNGVKKILLAIFGIGTYAAPILLLFIGICFIVNKGHIYMNKRFFGIMVFVFNTLLFIQMINMKHFYNGNIKLGIQKIYNSNTMIHGGIISYLIDIPLFRLFGITGCYIIYISIYVISYILISQIPLYDILIKFKPNFIKSLMERTKETKKNEFVNDNQIAVDGENVEKKEFLNNITSKIKIMDFIKNSCNSKDDNIIYEKPVEVNYSKKSTNEKSINEENINEELEKEIKENTSFENSLYEFPTANLLNQNNLSKLNKEDKRDLINNASKLEETLSSFGVEAKVIQVAKGPSVTRFELQPNAGVKVSKIVNLADDIALNLAASGVRIEAPIPGKAAVGIEVPNKDLTAVFLREVIESSEFVNFNKNIAFCLGKDIAGSCVVTDLTKMPHLLIAGATGSGKSVCINSLIISLLFKYSPEDVKLLMIDPKVVELSVYNGIPHLLIPVVTEPKKAAGALNWAVNEMTKRYKMFADNNVRNIEGYNDLVLKGKLPEKMPWIVIIVDELADLMMVCANDVEDYIGRLAQMARAAGMHLVIATQRPSVDVITGVIKANIPSRISFAVSSQIDSRTILDSSGAEKLLGKGDMLFYPVGESKPLRIQGAFISEEEVEKVVEFIKKQKEEPEYRTEILDEINTTDNKNTEIDSDELLNEAIRIIVEMGQVSTSLIQRKLRIGFNRAARIIEQMEEVGVISQKDGSKPRQILIKKEDLDKYK
ncbi:MAG: DNA translocase FtsK [Bacillota bacterium]|nr:DNA translocase FtsK [Bacillota bacterium]